MSSDFDDVLKQGYLKIKSKNIGSWNKRWFILKRASSKGGKRLEKYQDEKASLITKEDSKPIYLNHIKTVSRLPNDVKKHAFALVFNDSSSRQFACESDLDADEWHALLARECRRGTIAGPNIDILSNGSEADDMFNVYLLPSPNLDIFGECILQVTAEYINIWDATDPCRKLVNWPLTSLRRYGKDESKFTLEAGRHCDTGQGLFIFNTSQGQKIYQKVHSASVSIAEAHRMVSKHQEQQTSGNRPPIIRKGSDFSPASETHPPVKMTASYPGTADRAPLPLPRTTDGFATFPLRNTPEADAPPVPSNTNRKPLTYQPLEVEDGDYEQNVLPRPLPATPGDPPSFFPPPPSSISPTSLHSPPQPTGSSNNNNNTDDTYIYEEKYLEPAFRKFLASRKDRPE